MKRSYLLAFALCVVALVAFILSRKRADERLHLAHPVNGPVDFYGLAVDQDGRPLPGVTFELVAIAVEGNIFRGEQKDIRTTRNAVTDVNGRFELHAIGERIDEIKGTLPGYRFLSDNDTGTGKEQTAGNNLGFRFYNWGDPTYVGNPANPAIYVFVRDGAKVVTAKVSRGGAEGDIVVVRGVPWSTRWPNKPGFPRNPSIKGLTFREPTTGPATATSSTQQ